MRWFVAGETAEEGDEEAGDRDGEGGCDDGEQCEHEIVHGVAAACWQGGGELVEVVRE